MTPQTHFRFWLWLIRMTGVIVPRRLRGDWQQEWETELRYREAMLEEWDRLDWRNKCDLLRRSTSAFWDALLLQPQRLEDEVFQDVRYGIRILLQHKAFDAVAVLTLATEGVKLIATGMLPGLLGALALTRLLAGLLFSVGPTDALTFAAIAGLLAAVGLLACYVPARRATKLDALATLRQE